MTAPEIHVPSFKRGQRQMAWRLVLEAYVDLQVALASGGPVTKESAARRMARRIARYLELGGEGG